VRCGIGRTSLKARKAGKRLINDIESMTLRQWCCSLWMGKNGNGSDLRVHRRCGVAGEHWGGGTNLFASSSRWGGGRAATRECCLEGGGG
jgi:hypothetical protein